MDKLYIITRDNPSGSIFMRGDIVTTPGSSSNDSFYATEVTGKYNVGGYLSEGIGTERYTKEMEKESKPLQTISIRKGEKSYD